MSTEQRSLDRDICEIEASVIVDDRGTIVGCLCVDISEQGAKIEIDPAAELPARFTLALPVIAGVFEQREAELRWRAENMAGVRFTGTSTLSQPDAFEPDGAKA